MYTSLLPPLLILAFFPSFTFGEVTCSAGEYVSTIPLSYDVTFVCELCEPDYYQPDVNSTATRCIKCPEGLVSMEGSGECYRSIQEQEEEEAMMRGDYYYQDDDYEDSTSGWVYCLFAYILRFLIGFAVLLCMGACDKPRLGYKKFCGFKSVLICCCCSEFVCCLPVDECPDDDQGGTADRPHQDAAAVLFGSSSRQPDPYSANVDAIRPYRTLRGDVSRGAYAAPVIAEAQCSFASSPVVATAPALSNEPALANVTATLAPESGSSAFDGFLARAKIEHLKEALASEGICDLDTMLLVDNAEGWKEIGVNRIGDRLRLVDALKKERRERNRRGLSDLV